MRIGIDFDNTIVSYDALFHKVARELGVLSADSDIPVNKLAIRDYLRALNQEDIWTEMQGHVYGARMSEAQIFPQVLKVLSRIKACGHELAIISHKTKHPYLGKQYDLHNAARAWIFDNLCENDVAIIPSEQIFFELSKEEKLDRIDRVGCDIFIDDLPEILLAANFPKNTQRFLFDPDANYANKDFANVKIVSSWLNFESCLL